MANISQLESGPSSGFNKPDNQGKQSKSRRRDTIIVLLSALAIGALVLTVILGSLLLLQAALFQAKLRIAGLPESVVWLMQWRNGLSVIVVLSLLALVSYALARSRAARDRSRRRRAMMMNGVITSQTSPEDVVEHRQEVPLLPLTETRLEIASSALNSGHNSSEISQATIVGEPALAVQTIPTVMESIDGSPPAAIRTDRSSRPMVTLATTGFLTHVDNYDSDAEPLEISTDVDADGDLAEAEGIPSEKAQVIAPFHVNLRVDPQSNAEVLDLLEPGTEVTLLGTLAHEDGVDWRKVLVRTQRGWLVDSFLQPLK